jgi:hypothetical protein
VEEDRRRVGDRSGHERGINRWITRAAYLRTIPAGPFSGAGALAGLAVPVLFGVGLLLDGVLYGAAYLGVQYLIYSALWGADFSASSD